MWTSINFVLCLLAVAAVVPAPALSGDIEIVGGSIIDISQAPYQISLRMHGSHYCGGSIISNTHILTAAHCISGAPAPAFMVNAGTTNNKMNGVVVPVVRATAHPNYNPRNNLDFDIAVLKLSQPLPINSKIKVIAMAALGSQVPAGQEVTISGWGWTSTAPPPTGVLAQNTSETYSNSDMLKAVTLPVVDNASCQSKLHMTITNNMMCAGGLPQGGQAQCNGDSGGPVVYQGILVGAVSWGIKNGCAQPNKPAVQARVAAMRSWIDSQMN